MLYIDGKELRMSSTSKTFKNALLFQNFILFHHFFKPTIFQNKFFSSNLPHEGTFPRNISNLPSAKKDTLSINHHQPDRAPKNRRALIFLLPLPYTHLLSSYQPHPPTIFRLPQRLSITKCGAGRKVKVPPKSEPKSKLFA